MIIFPLRTDRRLRHRPYVNLALIVANFAVFVLTYKQVALIHTLALKGYSAEQIARHAELYNYYLHPDNMQWFQFFTYQFLHGSWLHVGTNMLFLYVFGNSVEDRLGPVGYLAFYLGAGVVAGIAHCLTWAGPVLGASGAVAGVSGMFLALFPLSHITIGYWIFIVGAFEVRSIYFILLYFFQDVLLQALGAAAAVAYMAHIGGTVFGFTAGLTLIATRILPRDPFDFLTLLENWRRRRQMRTLTRQGWSPWQADAITRGSKAPPPPKTTEAPDDRTRRVNEQRAKVLTAVAAKNHRKAVDAYEELLRMDGDQVLPRDAQLDVADLAMHAGRFDTAARGYELYRSAFPDDDYREEITLILGLIYARYLQLPARARPLLAHAASNHPDPKRRAAAREWLADLAV